MSVKLLPVGDVVSGESAGRLLLEDGVSLLAGEHAFWFFFMTITSKHQSMYSWRVSKFSSLSSLLIQFFRQVTSVWRHLQDSPTFNVCLDINPLCSRGLANPHLFQQLMTGYIVARGCGTALMFIFKELYEYKNSRPTEEGVHILPTNRDKGSGSPPGTSSYVCRAGSSAQGMLAHSKC